MRNRPDHQLRGKLVERFRLVVSQIVEVVTVEHSRLKGDFGEMITPMPIGLSGFSEQCVGVVRDLQLEFRYEVHTSIIPDKRVFYQTNEQFVKKGDGKDDSGRLSGTALRLKPQACIGRQFLPTPRGFARFASGVSLPYHL